MIRESTKKKDAEELKRALAVTDDYVPPPLIDIQAQFESKRRPMPSEINQEIVIRENAGTVDMLKEALVEDIHRGPSGASVEATEAAHLETVRRLKVMWAQAPEQPETRTSADTRNTRAHVESVDLIKAEMARTIHTEDYGG
jgi:hypothetical protein